MTTEIDQKFHLMLLTGRLLLQNSVSSERVHQAIHQLSDNFGWEIRLFVDYKVLTLTTKVENKFYSRFSKYIPAMKINMALTTQVYHIIDGFLAGKKTLDTAIYELETINEKSLYSRWLTVFMLGIAAGSLARIFEGDWQSFLIVGISTSVGLMIRQELDKKKVNMFLLPLIAAFVGGCIGGVAIRLGLTATPELCLLVPSMMLVPGVHLINGVLDLLDNHISIGISRLGFSMMTLAAIVFGLFVSVASTGTLITVSSSSSPLPLLEDIFFAGLLAAGFAIYFNVPKHILWACILSGAIGHGSRVICIEWGAGMIWGNLVASSLVGVMKVYFSRRFRAPSAAIAFGAVVGMIPGIFLFRAMSGLTQMLILGNDTTLPLLVGTVIMSLKALLMTLAIPVGLSLPTLLFSQSEQR
ncbi:MAG: threonine/serine exporter ThrE family protein [Trichodesmium sp.]